MCDILRRCRASEQIAFFQCKYTIGGLLLFFAGGIDFFLTKLGMPDPTYVETSDVLKSL
jgi:hypothetical protein